MVSFIYPETPRVSKEEVGTIDNVVAFIALILSVLMMGPVPLHIDNVSENISASTPILYLEKGIQMPGISESDFFTLNLGQWDDELLFIGNTKFGSVGFAENGVYFNLRGPETGHVLKYTFVNCNQVKPVGEDKCSHYNNYFIGNDESKWASFVPNYKKVRYEELWDNIDLVYYFNEEGLKYDLVVMPGGDYENIQFQVEGQEKIKLNNGKLQIEYGNIVLFHEDIPFSYYSHDHSIIPSEYEINNDIIVFNLDICDTTKEIVIDPLVFSTFLGDSNDEIGNAITIDSKNCSYVTGYTMSTNFPTSSGSYDDSHNGHMDCFVTKIDASGSNMIFSTYIGSGGMEISYDIEVDSKENIIITGITGDSDYPTTSNAIDRSHNGANDGFITKLNPSGSNLIFSTFIGGSFDEVSSSIKIDSDDNIVVIGNSRSDNFPTVTGCYDTTINGQSDVFLLKINSTGSSIIRSTFIGGGDIDEGYDLQINSQGNIVFTGTTKSSDYPTLNPFDSSINGNLDSYISIVDKNLTNLLYSSFLGGNDHDESFCIDLDNNDNIIASGYTRSNNFPITENAFQGEKSSYADIFISKFGPSGQKLIFSTFIGGTDDDIAYGLYVDLVGDIYTCGLTLSKDFPCNEKSYRSNPPTGSHEGFFLKMNTNGTKLLNSTYWASDDHMDYCKDIYVDEYRNLYVTGVTDKGYLQPTNFPITPNAYDTTHNEGDEVFVSKMKFSSKPLPPVGLFGYPEQNNVYLRWFPPIDDGGMPITYYSIYRGIDPDNLTMIITDRVGVSYSDHTAVWGEEYYYAVSAHNSIGESLLCGPLLVFDDEIPVINIDSSPENATTGDKYDFQVRAEDNVGIASAHVEYWYGEREPEGIDLNRSELYYRTWVGTIQIPENSLITMHYNITVTDPSSNSLIVDGKDVVILDNDNPELGEGVLLSDAFANETYDISIMVVDNILVSKVWAEIIHDSGKSRAVYLEEDEELWTASILIENSLENISLTYFAEDTSGNSDSWGPYNVTVHDREKPRYLDDLSDESPSTGDDFLFKVFTMDNIMVDSVWVEFWYDKIERYNASMVQLNTYEWSCPITIQDSPPDGMSLNFIFHVKDSSNNWMVSEHFHRTIIDNDAPVIKDSSNEVGTTGDIFRFDFDITDNIGVEKVYLLYTLDDLNRKIELSEEDGFSFQIELPWQLVGNLEYYAQATDVSGNWMNSSIINVEISDKDPPRIENIEFIIGYMDHNTLETGKEYRIKSVIWELNGLDKVRMEYWYGAEVKEVEMIKQVLFSDTGHFSCTTNLQIPLNKVLPLNFRMIATDDSGNTNITEDAFRPVKDIISPIIEPIADHEIMQGEILDITPIVSDNIGVARIEWEGSPILPTQGKLLGVVNEPGVHEIIVTVYDEEGNSNSTLFRLTVREKEEGIAAAGSIWIIFFIVLILLVLIMIGMVLFILKRKPGEAEEPPEKGDKVIPAGPKNEELLPTQKKLPPPQAPALKPRPSVITPPIYKTAGEMPRAPMPLRGDDYISPVRKQNKTGSKTQVKGELGPRETNMLKFGR